MLFTQLSGYPTIDINIKFIFNLIPPKIIIEVFIFTFLEYDIIFYSTRLDFLNMFMYIFKCFNYPFNNSDYYQYILSVSRESFISGKSSFINKKSPKMIGILSEYDPEILTTEKISKHFVLDIDNKNFFFLYKEKNDEIEDIISLHNYIKDCIEVIISNNEHYDYNKYNEEDNFKDGIRLYECIKMLMEELFYISKKVTAKDYNFIVNKPNFFNLFENENEIECAKSNNKILKAFYTFIIIIIQNFLNSEKYEGEKNSSNIERKSNDSEKKSNDNERKSSDNERKSSDNERKSSDSERKSSDNERKSSDSERKSSDSESIPESRIPSFVIDINEEENFQMKDKSFQMEDKNFQMEDKNFQMEDKNFQMKDKYLQIKIKIQFAKKSGQVFRKKFMKTTKYNSFVIKFCQHNEVMMQIKFHINLLMNLFIILTFIFLKI